MADSATTEQQTTPAPAPVVDAAPVKAAPAKGAPKGKPANSDEQKGGKKGGKKDKKIFNLKTPKGTRDYGPESMAVREKVFGILIKNFKKHGAVTIDTPVFELKETLTGKYGEDSKLIYDLQDQGGEICSLRYDLTVPFARYVAMNRIKNIKRYHIARVYRRDNPVMTKGRYREFYQCDFDIAGQYESMVPDAEVLKLMSEILTELDIGKFTIKLSHRKLLDGFFEICGVPADKFRAIASAVDKLDKSPWEAVKKEMLEKGLDEQAADKIQKYVELKGAPHELYKKLVDEKLLEGSKLAQEALADLKTLFEYTDLYSCTDNISFDLSLARGLDYYTGLIYEAVVSDADKMIGSVAAGGRYDGLVGIFGSEEIPAVGFSVGVERIFAIYEEKHKKDPFRTVATQVLVCSIDKNMLKERMKIAAELWAAGIPAEFIPKANPNIKQQLSYAEAEKVPLAIIFGSREVESGILQVKEIKPKEQASEQVAVPRNEIVSFIKTKLNL